MSRPSKPQAGRVRRWSGAVLLLAVWALLLSSCETAADFEDALPDSYNPLTASYVDTFTVRTSTVLADSVPSSTSSYLLTGRYRDARLGTITARGYLQLGLNGTLDVTDAVFDSLVLDLATDTYRYGDTTRQQTLEVHQLQTDLRGTATYYTADARPYDAAALGRRPFRAGKLGSSLRVRLADALGQRLLTTAQAGGLSTNDELLALLPGLVLTPGATDDAALLRFGVGTTALLLYYHFPLDPKQVVTYGFAATYGPKHFYQLEADRLGTLLSGLNRPRQGVPSALTAEESYIQAGLGVQTKVEFPYLLELKKLGTNLVVNAAELEAEVVAGSENRFLPPPSALTPRLTTAGNRGGAYFSDATGAAVTANYQRGISARTGLERGYYTLPLTSYCTQALARNIPNDGILLTPGSSGVAERVVLGSGQHPEAPMKLRLYFTRVGL